MKILAAIRNRYLGLFAALLILTQSVFAVGMPAPYATAKDHHPEKTELKQQIAAKASFIEVTARVTFATFLFYWVIKAFTALRIPVVKYQKCKALFVNSCSFNVYYTFISALAP